MNNMNNLRKPSEIILNNGKTLEEVLELHKKWLNNEEGGEKANLSREYLSYVDLSCTNLIGVDLSHSDLTEANLIGTNLSEADLTEANLEYANLSHSNLSKANLTEANLTEANLTEADLTEADLDYANLSKANLSKADLTEANLSEANFYLTNLYKVKGNFVGVENIGSRNDTTHYFYKDDRVICGCFDGSMKQFEEKVKEAYKEDEVEYKEYMIAIRTLKELAELYMNN